MKRNLLYIFFLTFSVNVIALEIEKITPLADEESLISKSINIFEHEKIDLRTGNLSFYEADVIVPGQNGLDIVVGRHYGIDRYPLKDFGSWQLNSPRLLFSTGSNKIPPGLCKNISYTSNTVAINDPTIILEDFSQTFKGLQFIDEYGVVHEFIRATDNLPSLANYEYVSKDNYVISCYATASDSTKNSFKISTPDGKSYFFESIIPSWNVYYFGVQAGMKYEYRPIVSRIEDKNGNWIKYDFSNGLKSITSSDNRLVEIEWSDGFISKLKMNGRVWRYRYQISDNNIHLLKSIEYPNGDIKSYSYNKTNGSSKLTMTLPTGGIIEYQTTSRIQQYRDGDVSVPSTKYLWRGNVLEKRTVIEPLTGARYVWDFNYTGDLTADAVTIVDGPLNKEVYVFDNDYSSKTFSTLRSHSILDGRLEIKKEEFDWLSGNKIGHSTVNFSPASSDYKNILVERRVFQDGDLYKTNFYEYDQFGYSHRRVESSPNSKTREIQTTFWNDTSKWIMGGVETSKIFDQNKLEDLTENTFDSLGQVKSSAVNGIVTTMNYYANGELKYKILPGGIRFDYSDYFRGQPRKVKKLGVATPELMEVNYSGTIKSSTDFRGNKTRFEYDSVDRLTKTTLPLKDSQQFWLNTNISYLNVDSEDLTISNSGLKIGLRKTVTLHGNYRLVEYLDGFGRVALSKEEDLSKPDSTRYRNIKFDNLLFETFSSQRSDIANETKGIEQQYDAIGRVKKLTTELGTKIIKYLGNNSRKVTDNRQYDTTYYYQSFGSPEQKMITSVESPEGITTSIERAVDGMVNSITQSGSYNGSFISSKRNYYYDSRKMLCQTYDPEFGYTHYRYDAAGRKVWELKGSKTSFCNKSAIPKGATSYEYDNRGFLQYVDYKSYTKNLSFEFDDVGNLLSSERDGVKWNYYYNSLNKLEVESLIVDGKSFTLSYGFDSLGNLNDIVYPDGRVIEFIPNAFGQATVAGNFANLVEYFPSGSLKSFVYGNKKKYQRVESISLLTKRIYVPNLVDLIYTYDSNANIESISDIVNPGESRYMSYDGLDRLRESNGPWGSGLFDYDPLGNIMTKKLGSKSYSYTYDRKSNLLVSVSGSKNYSMEYDRNGNIIGNGHFSFEYDQSNLMLTSNLGEIATYQYDANKRRV